MDRSSRSRIVMISIGLKEFDAAQKALDGLRKITGASAITMQMQAELHLRNGKPELARDAIQAALKSAPDYPPVMALGAEIFLKTNAIEQAERLSRMLVEKAPDASIGYRLLGTTLIRMNAPDKALQAVQPALDKGSKDPLLYTIAGEAALRLNDTPRAMALFEKAGALDPKAPGARTGLAMTHLARGDTERGIAELEKVSQDETGNTQADLILVSTHLRARQFDKALAAVDRLAAKLPDNVLPDNLRGTVLLAKGDVAGARKAFEQTLQRDPKFFAAASNLAALDLRDRKPDDARKRFTTLLEKDPKSVPAMLALGRLALADATSDKALEARTQAMDWYRKAHEADRSSLPATLALAGAHIVGKQYVDAIPMLQEALAANPNSIEVLDMLGTAYLQSDQQSLGMETLEKILRVRPGDPTLQFRMGELKLRLGDTTGALVHLRKSAELAPKAIEPRVAIAGVLARSGKLEEARKISVALQKEAPKSGLGIMLEGDLLMGERKFPEAASAYRRALAMQKTVPLQTKLHQAMIAMGKLDEADTLIAEFVKESPADVSLGLYAGDYEMARRRWPAAIAHYEKVLAVQPGNAIALNNQAWAMLQANDPKALAAAEKALQQAPNSAAIMDTLGMALLAQGNNERGILMLKQAVSIAPKDARMRMNLAEALARTGDKAGAAAQIDTVLSAVPKGPEAVRAQELRKKL